jgi:hypothetical protein
MPAICLVDKEMFVCMAEIIDAFIYMPVICISKNDFLVDNECLLNG